MQKQFIVDSEPSIEAPEGFILARITKISEPIEKELMFGVGLVSKITFTPTGNSKGFDKITHEFVIALTKYAKFTKLVKAVDEEFELGQSYNLYDLKKKKVIIELAEKKVNGNFYMNIVSFLPADSDVELNCPDEGYSESKYEI